MMTEKDFLDVFPQLKVDPELESLLGEVKVMKVSLNDTVEQVIKGAGVALHNGWSAVNDLDRKSVV